MSLVNQVLRDLEARRSESPDTSGLHATPGRPAIRRHGRWVVLVGVAALTGVGLLVVERLASRPVAPAQMPIPPIAETAPVETTVAIPVNDDVVVAEPEPVDSIVADDDPAVTAVEPLAAVDEPTPAPVTVIEEAPVRARTPEPVVPVPAPEGSQQRTLVSETPQQRASDAYNSGVRALSEGRRSTAENQFRAALGHAPIHHDARLALANLLAADGRVRDAEAQLQEGLQFAPHQWPLADRYARMLFERGDLAGAIGVLQRSPPDVAAAPEYHALLAALLQRAGNHDEAADLYRSLVGVDPDQGLWWMGLGLSLEGAGRDDAALNAYRRAVGDPRLSTDVSRFVRERIAVLDQDQSR